MEVNGAKVPIILQNIFFCVQQKKETHTGMNSLKVFKWWQIFNFGVEYPFKKALWVTLLLWHMFTDCHYGDSLSRV